jgi:polar amino acid transport system ATP-binding protein
MIKVDSIHKRFHDQEVLKGVSLNVKRVRWSV